MNLNYELTVNQTKLVEKALGSKIEYSVPVDLNIANLRYEGYLVIGKDKWVIIQNEDILECESICNYDGFKTTPLVGNVIIETYNEKNGSKIVARGTMLHAARYAYISQILNFKAQKKEVRIYNKEEERHCSKCGRVLVHGTRMCVHCMSKAGVFKRLFSIGAKHKYIIMINTLLLLVSAALSIISPRIQGNLIDECFRPVADGVTPQMSTLLIAILLMAVCLVGGEVINIIRGRLTARIGPKISADLRKTVYDRIQELSIGFLTSQRAGDIMNRITHDTNRICNLVQDFLSSLVYQGVVLIGVSTLMFMTDWRLALLILIPAPLMAYVQMKLWRLLLHKLFRRQFRLDDKTNSFLHDVLSGVRVVKAFGKEKTEVDRFSGYCRDFAEMSVRSERTWNLIVPACNFIISLSGFAVTYLAFNMILGGELTLGELYKFNAYAGLVSAPIGWLMGLPRKYADAAMSVDRIFSIIEEEPEIINAKEPQRLEVKGDISFNNVNFGYASYEPVLHDINLDIKQGEMIGLVGHSGSGKSTMINLLSRFYDVNEGSITVDGVDIRNIDTENLHSQIGMVLQETFLFTGTIFENIRYARPTATVREVIEAAKIANAHDFIVKFPDGYDTYVTENGGNLSGGERQRIAIARAVLVNPKILILDEATSALDIDTEEVIQQALSRLTQNRTTVAIAHRLSTLKNADRLVVLDHGEIAETGTHRELIKKQGLYYNLVMAQRQMNKPKLQD